MGYCVAPTLVKKNNVSIFREKDQGEHKKDIQLHEERMTNLREQMNKDREKAMKSTSRNMTEARPCDMKIVILFSI